MLYFILKNSKFTMNGIVFIRIKQLKTLSRQSVTPKNAQPGFYKFSYIQLFKKGQKPL